MGKRNRTLRRGAMAALGGLLAGLPSVPAEGPARAALPVAEPVFSSPLDIANPWFPVSPGSVKVYRGRERGVAVTEVESHLEDVRTFPFAAGEVPCRTVRETLFVGGVLLETSTSWYARADDGSVYAFGEVTAPGEDEEDAEPDEDDRSWVVGSLAPGDPPSTASVAAPALFMPADPEPGDLWMPEAGHPESDETDEALSVGDRVRVRAGVFLGCLAVSETSPEDRGRTVKWYAPGVGVVRTRARREWVRLEAGTLGEPARPLRRGGR